MTPLQRLAKETGMSYGDSRRLCRLVRRCVQCGVAECNGDPHPDSPDRNDKNENSRRWGIDVTAAQEQLTEFMVPFKLVPDFTMGLVPCLRDSEQHYIDIPCKTH